jgi:hypothetical protein
LWWVWGGAGYRLEGERGEGGVHHHPHAVPDATLVHVEVALVQAVPDVAARDGGSRAVEVRSVGKHLCAYGRALVTKAITPGDARVRSRRGLIVELVAQPAGGRHQGLCGGAVVRHPRRSTVRFRQAAQMRKPRPDGLGFLCSIDASRALRTSASARSRWRPRAEFSHAGTHLGPINIAA